MGAPFAARYPGQAVAAYREETDRLKQLFMIPTRRCHACGQYRTLVGSKRIDGHFHCHQCANAHGPYRRPA